MKEAHEVARADILPGAAGVGAVEGAARPFGHESGGRGTRSTRDQVDTHDRRFSAHTKNRVHRVVRPDYHGPAGLAGGRAEEFRT